MLITSACPLCGASKAQCGGHAAVTPVDLPTKRTENTMATEPEELRAYEYEVYGNTVTGQLTKRDAERLGARPVGESGDTADAPAADAPVTSKARKSVQNK